MNTITITVYGHERQVPANDYGEPTVDIVVESWRDVPKSISSHAFMGTKLPGMYRHSRLGIFVIVLGEALDAVTVHRDLAGGPEPEPEG